MAGGTVGAWFRSPNGIVGMCTFLSTIETESQKKGKGAGLLIVNLIKKMV
jgi:hypothetical protein